MKIKHIDLNTVLTLLMIGVLIYGGMNGWFVKIIGGGMQPAPQAPLYPDKEYQSYTLSVTLIPNDMCAGDTTEGTIYSNIGNGICSIFVNSGTGYYLYQNVNLASNGIWTGSATITTVGAATFRVVCCDTDGNCKISNEPTLTVRACEPSGPPPPPSGSYTCGVTGDLQCGGTCPSAYPACGIVSFGDYDTCVCINEGTEMVAPDWKPGGSMHNSDLFTDGSDSGSGSGVTCSSPYGNDIYTRGTCTDSTGSDTDSCANSDYVNKNFCVNNMCWGVSKPCPTGYMCSEGRCVTEQLGDPDYNGCSSSSGECLAQCKSRYNADDAHCEAADWYSNGVYSHRVAPCPEWSNAGLWKSCFLKDAFCGGGIGCDCVCEIYYD